MGFGFIDTHCHLNDEKYFNDFPGIFQRMEDAGVTHAIVGGSDLESSKLAVELANQYPFLAATVGVHPHEAKDIDDDTLRQLAELARDKRVVAIGEIGLDYHYDFSPREVQREGLKRQIELAKELKVPIVIHEREAFDDLWDILLESDGLKLGGHWHCITTTVENAKKIAEYFYIGITGIVTFNKSQNIVDIVKNIPLERILLETDAPYLAPIPHRGKTNEPSFLNIIAGKVAEIKGIPVVDVENITVNNSFAAYPALRAVWEMDNK